VDRDDGESGKSADKIKFTQTFFHDFLLPQFRIHPAL
jgi:hypothetical protein